MKLMLVFAAIAMQMQHEYIKGALSLGLTIFHFTRPALSQSAFEPTTFYSVNQHGFPILPKASYTIRGLLNRWPGMVHLV